MKLFVHPRKQSPVLAHLFRSSLYLHTHRSVELNADLDARLVGAFRLANLCAGMAFWLQMKNANF